MRARTDDNGNVVLTPENGPEEYILLQLCGKCSGKIVKSDATIPELRLSVKRPSMDVWIRD